jgi:polysaccharide pyruvyl transferase CsaB
MHKLLLAGYIGCGNLGDDAMALGFMEAAHQADCDFMILSGNPDATYSQYKVHSVPRMDSKAVDKAIDACDALVFPGGSIFQDVTSVRSVAYYSQLVKKAKSKGKKVLLLSQGVGPLNRFFGKRMAAAAFRAADAITVRDPQSASAIKALGVNRPVKVTADCAFLLPQPTSQGEGGNFSVGNMKTVGLSPRPYGGRGEVVALFGELARLLFQANYLPVLIEMDKNEDGSLIQEISNSQGGKIPDMRKMTNPVQVQERIARMDAVIAMRLHAGILAATVGVPPMMISYDPKVDAFARQLGLGSAIPFKGATAQRLFDSFQQSLKDRTKNLAILEKKRDEMTKLALENISVLRETLR